MGAVMSLGSGAKGRGGAKMRVRCIRSTKSARATCSRLASVARTMQSSGRVPPRFSLAAKWKRETEDWKGGERREASNGWPIGPDLQRERERERGERETGSIRGRCTKTEGMRV